MPRCAAVVDGPTAAGRPISGQNGVVITAVVVPDSPDASGKCLNYVLLHSSEFEDLQGNGTSLPLSADAATAWGLGFSFVVGSYAIGWAVGAVVNFINRN